MRFLTLITAFAVMAFAAHGHQDGPADMRAYWAYEGGWFAKAKDGSWYELNEQTYRKLGKPSKFKEAKRTKEYVELYDEDRKVAIRLSDESSEVRLSDRPDARWEKLYKGRWKTPVTGD